MQMRRDWNLPGIYTQSTDLLHEIGGLRGPLNLHIDTENCRSSREKTIPIPADKIDLCKEGTRIGRIERRTIGMDSVPFIRRQIAP